MEVLHATESQDFNVTLTSADTEYELALPNKVKKIEMQARGTVAVRHSFMEGVVADGGGAGPSSR